MSLIDAGSRDFVDCAVEVAAMDASVSPRSDSACGSSVSGLIAEVRRDGEVESANASRTSRDEDIVGFVDLFEAICLTKDWSGRPQDSIKGAKSGDSLICSWIQKGGRK
jgi:hypothetical protein